MNSSISVSDNAYLRKEQSLHRVMEDIVSHVVI
jgi:hypothetical protein